MDMRTKYIPAITMLTAGAIVCILNIVQRRDVLDGLKILLAVLVIFYVIGLLARKLIDKILIDLNEKNSDEQPEFEDEDGQNPDNDVEEE